MAAMPTTAAATPSTARLAHLVGLDGVGAGAITALLDRAVRYSDAARGEAPPLDLLAGRNVANIFLEDSTRTRCSFTLATRRLGGETIEVAGSGSSQSKGETLLDMCLNLQAMGVDAFVIRTSAAGAPHQVARRLERPVINAGDGRHEHPTQGLLDLMTMRERLGGLSGRTVAIVGDIANSRVARSNLFGLTTLGANVVLVGPPGLAPSSFERITNGPGKATVARELDDVLPHVDAVMMLRVQFEREAGRAISSVEEFSQRFCLTADREAIMPEHAIVMHPGPINRGLEMESAVADDPERSVIMQQVTNGIAVRMAVLATVLGA